MLRTTDRIIAIGASTGGTEAIREVLMGLPADCPAIVIAQHIPEAFSLPFTRRMDSLAAMSVVEPADGQYIMPGHVYIAPGGRHLLVERDGARYRCRLNNGPPVNRHCPSVDVLFRSVAQNVGPNAVGVILTGMGDDGARGLKEMLDAGARTMAQDEASSVVWGMPGAAVKLGGAQDILPLSRVAENIMRLAQWHVGGAGHRGRNLNRGERNMTRMIMTVDDSTSMRQMVKATLLSAGYGVVEAADGQEALDYARDNPVDLVITDVNMPRMDGITLVSELRPLPAYRLTPLLLLTTESSMDKKMEGKKAGATGWLVKPFNPAQLLATLARVL